MKSKTYLTLLFVLILVVIAALFDLSIIGNRPFKLGLDLQGGSHLVYQADLSQIEKKDWASTMEGLRDVIERRINLFGVGEPIVQTERVGDSWRLIVELPGIKNVSEAIKMIGQTPYLEFREPKPNYDELVEKNKDKLESGEMEIDELFQPTSLTGRYLKKAQVTLDPNTYEPRVSLQFNEEGARIFEELTARNIGKPLAIYIDDVLISAPVVKEKISHGRAQITGRFTPEEAKKLARNLSAGALPVPIKLISQETVGPTLGAISLEKSLRAGLIGFLAIVIFMILFYRLPGLLASISLVIYIILVLALFKIIPVTLTLAGIAGFILSIGMAIDANVLIFSRMREERKEQKSFERIIEDGFSRAWPSIRDSNVTTLIVALILFGLGTSFVKGFALTLGLGILVSIFSAIFVTKNFLRCFINTRLEKWQILWK
ncbi:protein translocase subunit SecD [bacterium]|nr:protein translocase subunit SecD [bacterium]